MFRKILKVFLGRTVNKTEPFLKLKGQLREMVFWPIQYLLFWEESTSIWIFFIWPIINRGRARFSLFPFRASPTALIFNEPFS